MALRVNRGGDSVDEAVEEILRDVDARLVALEDDSVDH